MPPRKRAKAVADATSNPQDIGRRRQRKRTAMRVAKNHGASDAEDDIDDDMLEDDCSDSRQLWIDKYVPLTEVGAASRAWFLLLVYQDDIAVHKQKLAAVREWLTMALDEKSFGLRSLHQSHRILVLTGISGSGKTAAIRVLSLELRFEIVEWINPIWATDPTEQISKSLSRAFDEFLTSARKSNGLAFEKENSVEFFDQNTAKKKIVLIEDLPNVYNVIVRNAFQESLRNHVYSSNSVYPIVLIVSDSTVKSNSGDWRESLREVSLSWKSIIPEDVRLSSGFSRIHFNPIAPTFMMKSLNSIISREYSKGSQKPSRAQIDKILMGKKLEPGELPDDFPGSEAESRGTLNSLTSIKSDPFKSNAENVFDSSHVDFDTFVSYLSENYTSVFTDVEECVQAADFYAMSDAMNGPWKVRVHSDSNWLQRGLAESVSSGVICGFHVLSRYNDSSEISTTSAKIWEKYTKTFNVRNSFSCSRK
ncbi:Cell cycle checkpoint protein rad17 [Entophlyctis sp. JEL0112]|nr:Cell cycle checkpoint protein rad17 [Entophlyctis sp. JEL0112]